MQLVHYALKKKISLPAACIQARDGQLTFYPRTIAQLWQVVQACREFPISFSLCPYSEDEEVVVHLCQLAGYGLREDGFFRCNLMYRVEDGLKAGIACPPLLFSQSFLLSQFIFPSGMHASSFPVEVWGISKEGEPKSVSRPNLFSFQNELCFFPLEGRFFVGETPKSVPGLFSSFDHAWESAAFLFQEGLITGFSLYPPDLVFPFGFSRFEEWLGIFVLSKKGEACPPSDVLQTIALSFDGYLGALQEEIVYQKASSSCLFFFCPDELIVSMDSQIKNFVHPLLAQPCWQGLHLVDDHIFLVWYKFMFDQRIVGDKKQAVQSVVNSGAYLGARSFSPQLPRTCKKICSLI